MSREVNISIDWLKQVHRDLDACQKVIWLAGVKPRGYGFDPAYCNDAQARLAEIDALIASGQQQATPPEATKPAPIQVEAVATTKEYEDGELYLDWIVEGGIAALEFAGQTLLIAHGDITDESGTGVVYTANPDQCAHDLNMVNVSREAITRMANDIAYAVFNLAGKRLEELKHGVVETTDPADSALIVERRLRGLLNAGGEA